MKNITILGSRIDNLTKKDALFLIKQFIASKKPHQICTVNPEYLMAAQNDEELQYILNHSDCNVADGGGILFAAKYRGEPLKEKITGVDLVKSIFKLSQKHGWKIFLLGGMDDVAKKTADILTKTYPGIKICGCYEGKPVLKPITKKIFTSGYQTRRSIDMKVSKMMPKSNINILQQIIAKKPHILLVAYGCPKQDKFIARYMQYMQVPVAIGVGGTFDYLAGKVKYAPDWMRKLHLEWLYRLFTQKNRFGRIITATVRFPWAVITEKKDHVK